MTSSQTSKSEQTEFQQMEDKQQQFSVSAVLKEKDNNVETTPSSASSSSKTTKENITPTSIDKKGPLWIKLKNLEALFTEGFICEAEYKERRVQLVDQLTGTSALSQEAVILSDSTVRKLDSADANYCVSGRKHNKNKGRVLSSIVVPQTPPNFQGIPKEIARKHCFDLRSRQWTSQEIYVSIHDTPFAKGGLRLVYHMQEYDLNTIESEKMNAMDISTHKPPPMEQMVPSSYLATDNFTSKSSGLTEVSTRTSEKEVNTSFVAKLAIDPSENLCTYFRDVEMQSHCAYYARLFNSYNPPRRIEFCKAWVIELVERNGSPLCAVEKYIQGAYKKHNNNFGYVNEDERNTPQAFSHFTYEASAHTMLVVDIQGVGDHFTDPQIHTINGSDFGKGNLGRKGFEKFLSTHRCNSICRYLKLPSINPKYDPNRTIPALPYMNNAKILRKKFQESHYFESTPALQKYISSHNILEEDQNTQITDQTWVYRDNKKNERCTPGALGCMIL